MARVVVSLESGGEVIRVHRSVHAAAEVVPVDHRVEAEIDPTGELVGVRVHHPSDGFDLERLSSRWPLDEDVRRVLADLWAKRGLLPRLTR